MQYKTVKKTKRNHWMEDHGNLAQITNLNKVDQNLITNNYVKVN